MNRLMKSLLIVIAYLGVIASIAWLGSKYPTVVFGVLALGLFGMLWKIVYDSLS
jgi:hypothetical protein